MDYGLLIVVIIMVVLIVGFLLVHFGFATASANQHEIHFGGDLVYGSSDVIPNTSDGVSLIYYATPRGVFSYNTADKSTVSVSPLVATGLAYSEGLLILSNGDVYYLPAGTTTPVIRNVTALFSTTSGYAYVQNGKTQYNGLSTTVANGDFITLRYSVS